jgi:transposase
MPERPFSRDLVFLLPPSLDEWVAGDDPVRFIAAFVDQQFPTIWTTMGWDRQSARRGAPRYNPTMLLCAWLYGFFRGERSCRAVERVCRENISARWLTGNQCPDHNTLWRFWDEHRAAMRLVLQQSVTVAVTSELVDLAVLAVDGTKVRANAANERSLTAAQLEALLGRLEQEIARVEDQGEGDDDGSDPRLPDPAGMANRVRAALADLNARPVPRKRNLTDPDAVFVKTRSGFVVGYSAETAVVATRSDPARPTAPGGRIIAATEVIAAPVDTGQLAPMIAQAEANLGERVGVTVADAGYTARRDIGAAAALDAPVIVPEPYRRDPYHWSWFVHDPVTDTLRCPQGQTLQYVGTSREHTIQAERRYGGIPATCRACPAVARCTHDGTNGRTVRLHASHAAVTAIRIRRESPPGSRILQARKSLIEPVFGILKTVLRGARMHHRGLAGVNAEWALLATAFNLKTMALAWKRDLVTAY